MSMARRSAIFHHQNQQHIYTTHNPNIHTHRAARRRGASCGRRAKAARRIERKFMRMPIRFGSGWVWRLQHEIPNAIHPNCAGWWQICHSAQKASLRLDTNTARATRMSCGAAVSDSVQVHTLNTAHVHTCTYIHIYIDHASIARVQRARAFVRSTPVYNTHVAVTA